MKTNKYLSKFNSIDYLKDDTLIGDSRGDININSSELSFSNLEFEEKVKLNSYSLELAGENPDLFEIKETYTFQGTNKDGSLQPSLKLNEISMISFSGCIFNDEFIIRNLPDNCIINFEYCEFENNVYINKQTDSNKQKINIKEIIIQNSIFKKDFSISNTIIDEITIKGVDFESLSEFYKVTFKNQFSLKEITYRGFSLFDKCIFDIKADFEYIIFEKFTSFRGVTFKQGINLDYTSSNDTINFFDANGLDNTNFKDEISQETYRIIKHNFEKLGNKIEANKYHALELGERKKELENNNSSNWKEKWVFRFHNWSSEHSTNWFRSLLWIFFIGVSTTLLSESILYIITPFIIYFISAKCNDSISFHLIMQIVISGLLVLSINSFCFDDIFKYINIIIKPDEFENNLLMTFNKLSLGYLYYQFLMSVRKDTRK